MYNEVKHKLLTRLESVYSQDQHMGGRWTSACEEKIKELTGRKHVLMVNSGTSALFLIFLAMGIKKGDRVMCINHSIPSSVMPPKILGAELVFNDIDRHGQQNLNDVETNGIKAIMTTGLYGDCHDNDSIAKSGIPIVNDSCQAFLSKYKGKEATSIGDASTISFAQNKTCPVFGTYGAVLTDREELAENFRYSRRNGFINKDYGEINYLGINAQPHEDKCVQVFTSLEYIDEWQERRHNIAEQYRNALKDTGIKIRTSPLYSTTNNHKFVLFVHDNVAFKEKLSKMGIESHLHYQYNFSKNKVLSNDVNRQFPVTNFFIQHALTIPSHPWLTDMEVKKVINSIKQCLTQKDLDLII